MDRFSDAGSIPAVSTIHSHVQWEIRKDRTWLSFACLVRSLFVMASIAIENHISIFSELNDNYRLARTVVYTKRQENPLDKNAFMSDQDF